MATNTIRGRAEIGQGGVVTVRLIVNHPMLVERPDPKTGQTLPPHFIEEISVTHAGDTLMAAAWGQAVSTNPFLQFSFTGAKAGDQITVSWRDNKGDTDTAQVPVK